ncbi:MAG: hypothetical protein RL217_1287 [Pseudomonadota bacterium]|jgi:hypothetical protein
MVRFIIIFSAFFSMASFSQNEILIRSNGKNYSPVLLNHQAQSATAQSRPIAALYSGQIMQAQNTQQRGVLTGSILIKTQNQQALMNYPNANSLKMGEAFVLLTFPPDTNLLAALTELQALHEVQEAELEVNLKQRKTQ